MFEEEIVQTFAAAKSQSHFMIAATAMEGDGRITLWSKIRRRSTSNWDALTVILIILLTLVGIRILYEVSDPLSLVNHFSALTILVRHVLRHHASRQYNEALIVHSGNTRLLPNNAFIRTESLPRNDTYIVSSFLRSIFRNLEVDLDGREQY